MGYREQAPPNDFDDNYSFYAKLYLQWKKVFGVNIFLMSVLNIMLLCAMSSLIFTQAKSNLRKKYKIHASEKINKVNRSINHKNSFYHSIRIGQ